MFNDGWGLYAIAGWQEQHQFRLSVPRKEYEQLVRQFNPTRFDPDAWLDLAEAAGMKYLCFTTKHIDGFCLWDTKQTDYSVMNIPYGKDVLAMLANACHRRGFPLCVYYSIADMHHSNYPNAGRNYELPRPDAGDEPNLEKYLAFVKAQVHELCTQYGEIGGFWWDANVIEHRDPSFNALIRSLQPTAVINNRGFDQGDFGTPERDYDASSNDVPVFDGPTEACQSIGMESWGYRTDEDYYSDAYLIRSIDMTLAKGGNYLLNVGSRADGVFPAEGVRILQVIGQWYRRVGESFAGTKPDPSLTTNRDVLVTRKGNTLFIHLVASVVGDRVLLPPIHRFPQEAILLNTGQPVAASLDVLPGNYATQEQVLRLYRLPVNKLSGTVAVIRLTLDADNFPRELQAVRI